MRKVNAKAWRKAQRKKSLTRQEHKRIMKEAYENKRWYTIRAILGNQWANWFVLIGARQRGKTFSVQRYVLDCFFDKTHPLYHKPFYWMRLNDIAIRNMLMNNGAKMFEPLLVGKYPELYKIKVRGDSVFLEDGTLLCRCYGLSVAYNNKGAAIFNAAEFKGVNIIIDEVALEKGQRKTFDVVYNLKMQVENVCRNERNNVRIFLLLNNTEECPEILKLWNFIPLEFGIYKIKRTHCVIDYIPNTKGYAEMRKNSLAGEIDTNTGNFTNEVKRDLRLIYKGRLTRPFKVVKYTKDESDWYTIWEGNIICPYNGEKKDSIPMVRYIDNDKFIPELKEAIIEQEDARAFKYRDILTQTRWRQDMEMIKKR